MKKVIVSGPASRFFNGSEASSNNIIIDLKIFKVENNTEVLEIHKKEQADVIIASLEDDRFSGDELCNTIRSNHDIKDVSIILICKNDITSIERCNRARANRCLTEPLKKEILLDVTNELLKISTRQGYIVLTNVTVEGEEFSRFVACKTINISLTGILLDTERELLLGQKINLSFVLPGMKRISASGEVTRVVEKKKGIGYQYGVRFENLGQAERTEIERFIKRRRR